MSTSKVRLFLLFYVLVITGLVTVKNASLRSLYSHAGQSDERARDMKRRISFTLRVLIFVHLIFSSGTSESSLRAARDWPGWRSRHRHFREDGQTHRILLECTHRSCFLCGIRCRKGCKAVHEMYRILSRSKCILLFLLERVIKHFPARYQQFRGDSHANKFIIVFAHFSTDPSLQANVHQSVVSCF